MQESIPEESPHSSLNADGKPQLTNPDKGGTTPQDKGWGWVVCFGAFVVHFLTVGQQNSAGVLYSAIMDEYSTKRGETALVASLAASVMYLFAALSTSLSDRFGSRVVVMIGSLISAAGLLASSYSTTLPALYATYGFVWGLGSSFGLFPSLVILTKYFKRRLAFASGIALAGAALGTLVYGPLIQVISSKYGVSVTFKFLACLQSLMFLSALTFRPVTESNRTQRKKAFDCSIFNNRAYIVWLVSLCMFMLVFLVPFVHLVRFAEDKGVNKTSASLLTGYMAIGVLLGCVIFGILCDLPCFNRLKVCQLSLLSMAILTSVVTIATKYVWISLYAFAFGFFDGCFEMLVPVITRDLVGVRQFGHAIGALYCLLAFPKTLGPPIAGWLFDVSNSYSVSFYVTGAVTTLATSIMFLLNWIEIADHEKIEVVMHSSESESLCHPTREAQEGLVSTMSLDSPEFLQPQQRSSFNEFSSVWFLHNSAENVVIERLTVV